MRRRVFLFGLLLVLAGGGSPLKAFEKESYLFQEAMKLKAAGKQAESFDLLRHCLSVDSTDAAACYELAACYRGIKDMATSLSLLEKAHAYSPDNEWITLQLASTCKETGDLSRTVTLIEELISAHPEKTHLYFPLSQLYLTQGNAKAALQALERLENFLGVKEELTLAKCEVYEAMGQHAKAIREIEKLARTQPENSHLQIGLAFAYIDNAGEGKNRKKAFEKAFPIIDKEVRDNPDNGECLMALVEYHLKCGNDSAVVQGLRTVIDNPKIDLGTKLTALQYFTRQTPQDSVYLKEAFGKVLEQYPEEYDIHQMYVIWLMQHNETGLSKTELRNVLDMNPNQMKVWQDYLSLFLAENDVENVEAISREALTCFPEEPAFWFYLALSKSIRKDYPAAIEAYLEAAAHAGPDRRELASECYGNIGDLCHELKDTATSYAYYEKALEMNPENVLVLNNYAYFLCLEGKDLDKAEQMSRKSVRIEASNSTYLDTYAWVCFRQGNFKMAKIYIERALLHLKEKNPEILEHQGDILWFCHERQAAAEAWKEALQVSDNPSDALKDKAATGEYQP